MCGENMEHLAAAGYRQGSSPRVRGKLTCGYCSQDRCGLIPACAGKTRRDRVQSERMQAHPRVCGENRPQCLPSPHDSGSSPRVRGKRDVIKEAVRTAGLIPACAGKTLPSLNGELMARAHPRVCGENVSVALMCLSIVGSSPRVRGKHLPQHWSPFVQGLIPACAGKTTVNRIYSTGTRAHPRVCGENSIG